MSKTPPQPFSPEAVQIASIAAVILLQPANLASGMSYQDACARAYNLLVSAQRSVKERAEAFYQVSKTGQNSASE